MDIFFNSESVENSEDVETCNKEERISILARKYAQFHKIKKPKLKEVELVHIAQNKEDKPDDLDNTMNYELVNQEDVNLVYLTYDFLKPENIKDKYTEENFADRNRKHLRFIVRNGKPQNICNRKFLKPQNYYKRSKIMFSSTTTFTTVDTSSVKETTFYTMYGF
uniref:Uncharacterized protein n=1 Tax=Strongyloides papillosus TaxID=174720 RepID=A0A0N5BPB2_STREA